MGRPNSDLGGIPFELVLTGSTLAVLPVAQERMPNRLREAITRRRVAAVTGRCPCGGRIEITESGSVGEPARATVWHETDCAAQSEVFDRLLDEWQGPGPARTA